MRLRNWRLRPALLLFVVVPTGTAVGLGGASLVSSWQSAVADQRTEALASLCAKVGQLAFRIEAERDTIAWYIAAKRAPGELLQVIRRQERSADSWVESVRAGAVGVGPGYSLAIQDGAQAVLADLRSLPSLRKRALTTHMQAIDVIDEYNAVVNSLLALDDQVALSSTDPQLTSTARSMAPIARQEDELAMQRAIVVYGLEAHNLNPAMRGRLTVSVADERADLAEFRVFATPSQVAMFSSFLSASRDDRAMSDEQDVLSNTNRLASVPFAAANWWRAMSTAVNATHRFEETLANSAADRARVLRERAIISAVVIGGIIVLVLLFSLLLTVFLWRSITDRPPGFIANWWRQRRRRGLRADVVTSR
jgi:hypothetical protein